MDRGHNQSYRTPQIESSRFGDASYALNIDEISPEVQSVLETYGVDIDRWVIATVQLATLKKVEFSEGEVNPNLENITRILNNALDGCGVSDLEAREAIVNTYLSSLEG